MRGRNLTLLLVVALIASGALLASAAKVDAKDAKGKAKKPPTAFVHQGKNWRVHQAENGRAFYFSVETGRTQWQDPRYERMTAEQRTLVWIVVLVPVVLCIIGSVAYLIYMRKTRPDLFKGPKKPRGMKNWERNLVPGHVPKLLNKVPRSASPPPPEAEAKKVK